MKPLNKLILTGLATISLTLGGCAIHSVNEYGEPCVIGQTCPGLLRYDFKDGYIAKNMIVRAVHKPGSPEWNKFIRINALAFKMKEDEVRAAVKDFDAVLTSKAGFMYAMNTYANLYAKDLNVGDVIDIKMKTTFPGNQLIRIVKRANADNANKEAEENKSE